MIRLIDKQKIILMHTNEGKSQRQISREFSPRSSNRMRTAFQSSDSRQSSVAAEPADSHSSITALMIRSSSIPTHFSRG